MAGAAFSSLVCSRGIEVSIFIEPEYRRKGLATVLGASLVRYCVENNADANWDAANPESCQLAERLGYVPVREYDAWVTVSDS